MKTVTISNLQELPYAMEEAVNRLRVNIGFLGSDIRKIMVISSFPNEGKSLVSMQLWRQMAEAGIPTMFLDMDLRKSVLSQTHQITVEKTAEPEKTAANSKNNKKAQKADKLLGTSNYLSGNMPLEDVICHTQYENGDILFNTENVVNPSMLLESARFTDMLNYLAEKYRYVFLDSPPLNLVSDGERIGNHCDGALLVVRSEVTPIKAVKATISQLERAGCPLLGIVLNRASAGKGGYYTKRYGYYGGKGYYGNEYYGSKK